MFQAHVLHLRNEFVCLDRCLWKWYLEVSTLQLHQIYIYSLVLGQNSASGLRRLGMFGLYRLIKADGKRSSLRVWPLDSITFSDRSAHFHRVSQVSHSLCA